MLWLEPFYLQVADEVAVFEAAYAERIPVLLKGPTGCGKTRFIEYMAWRLANTGDGLDSQSQALPLVTVTCISGERTSTARVSFHGVVPEPTWVTV